MFYEIRKEYGASHIDYLMLFKITVIFLQNFKYAVSGLKGAVSFKLISNNHDPSVLDDIMATKDSFFYLRPLFMQNTFTNSKLIIIITNKIP